MENQINNRLRMLINTESISNKKFCEIIGISEDTLKRTFNRDSNPGAETLIKISEKFPQYSINWLLTGRGDMDLTNESELIKSRRRDHMEGLLNTNSKLEETIVSLNAQLDEKDKAIVSKSANESEFISYLKSQVEELKQDNEELKVKNEQLAEQNGYYKGLLDSNGISYKQTAS